MQRKLTLLQIYLKFQNIISDLKIWGITKKIRGCAMYKIESSDLVESFEYNVIKRQLHMSPAY